MQELAAHLPAELVEWFSSDVDEGDAPELHVVGLRDGDLVRCFDVLQQHAPCWSDRRFHLDDERVDVTVDERPDVAELVASGRVTYACIGAEAISIDGVVLPLLEMFLYADEMQFFWWPGDAWTRERVAAFFMLLLELIGIADGARLRPDPRYSLPARRALGEAMSKVVGTTERLDLDARLPGTS